jgi:predicted ATPase
MGVFGAPVAHGDDSERAVRAAFAVRDWAEREGLELRIAVNTGEAIVELDARPGHGEAMVAGDVVNTAARLQAAAPAGSVLVGEETHAATRNAIEYRPAQPVVAKGKEMPVRSWLAVRPVTGVGERPTAPVPLIGRDRELAVLTDLWNRVAADGKSRFVTVFGPSGIGKSRIALELAQLVGDQGGSVIRGRSTPYGASSPYSAFAQQIKQIAGIFDSDDADDARAKLVEAVSGVAGSAAAEEHAPHLAMLLGLETDEETADREQLFFSARVLVESLALKGPLLLLYDDIHWADGSLLDLLETLGGRVREAPVLFVALSRPELLGARPGWGGGLPAYTALPLDPLDESASVELAEGLLAGNEGEEGVAAAVAGTAEGNPLFIEELVASLAERSTRGTGALPTSVRAIVAARLDSLPAAERTVLVDASVVGRVFWRGALAEITPREDLSQLLGSLETRDLVQREAVSRIKGDQQYAFKHGLIQEVAYATLPRAARRSRHAAAARFLEAANVASVSREALGRHWREAGEIEQAVHHLVLAGDQAGRGWAKQRAVELYREALELVPEDGAQRRDVLRKLAVAVQAVYHLQDVGGLPAGGLD